MEKLARMLFSVDMDGENTIGKYWKIWKYPLFSKYWIIQCGCVSWKIKQKKKKKVFVSDYRRSYDRQEKKCKQTFGLNHVKQCILWEVFISIIPYKIMMPFLLLLIRNYSLHICIRHPYVHEVWVYHAFTFFQKKSL